MTQFWLIVAAVNGLVSVAAGAFGAHGLRARLEPRMLEIFETGARYQMYHALALLAVAWLTTRTASSLVHATGWCFLAGILIFSGSLYVLSTTGWTKLGMITPVGGILFIVGWILLAVSATKLH